MVKSDRWERNITKALEGGKEMKRIIILIVTVLGLMIAIGAGVIVYRYENQAPNNPAYASGNLAGNLYNGGYFCEYNGEVYYSNTSDHNYLYRIQADKTIVKEKEASVFCLNIYDGYLYYSKDSFKSGTHSYLSSNPYGIYQVNLKTKKKKCLTNSMAPFITLCGNTVLYQEYTDTSLYFSRSEVGEKNATRILEGGYVPACSEGGYLYYAELSENHNIYRYNPLNSRTELVYKGNCTQPICIGTTLYFIDLDDGYSLKRVNLSGGEPQVITSEHCINYNTDGVTVFVEIENSPSGAFGLYRCNIDGTDMVQITEQACKYINMTNEYTYFTFFMDDSVWYRVPTRGNTAATLFDVVLE